MSPHGSADDSNGEATEILDINFYGIANLNQTEYTQKTSNKYSDFCFELSPLITKCFAKSSVVKYLAGAIFMPVQRLDIRAGLKLNKVKYPMAYTYL